MSNTSSNLMQHYAKLTEFLGYALGPDYEVVLHDLTDKNHSIVAIANNHVSGREIGAPLTNMALSILKDKSYETSDYRLHYYGLSTNGRKLRSNTMFIKQNERPIGMLCINFDDSRYRELSTKLMGLSHPDWFVEKVAPPFQEQGDAAPGTLVPESFRNSTEAVAADAIERELKLLGITAERLNVEERLKIISALEKSGIFLLKGAVKDVASQLRCSQASVYRYLAQVKAEARFE